MSYTANKGEKKEGIVYIVQLLLKINEIKSELFFLTMLQGNTFCSACVI